MDEGLGQTCGGQSMMRSGPLLFLGVFFAMATSWLGGVFYPTAQLGGAKQVALDNGLYPSQRPGLAAQGAEVYRANGCYVCHSQSVAQPGFGSDQERGWGRRRTVAEDYLWDRPVMLGEARNGPDLTNVGARETNAVPYLVHLFNPQAVVAGSMMPAYRYLFEVRRISGGVASADALPVAKGAVEDGFEVVPRPEAIQLAAYLMSLHSEEWLYEVPPPPKPAAAEDAGTNAPPAAAAPNK
jgi:cytochrome c oxidase cbb3-type subunit 2